MDGDAIASFVGLTGASEEVARGVLGITGGDIEQAVSLYFDNPDIVASLNSSAGSSSSAPVLPPINTTGSLRSERPRGSASRDNPITISSDDEDDFPMTDNDGWGDEEAANVARNAQEEEDAAMARRLQEEMYGAGGSGGAVDPEGIRAPMARTTETLVAPSYGGMGMGIGDDDDEAELQAAAMRAQLNRRRAQQRAQSNNPFAQAGPWGPTGPANGGSGPVSGATPGQLRLAELFKPPFDLITHLPLDEAREQGREEKKWLLVNIQDMSVFSCQVLNRDIWKDERVRQLVQENFVFMQYTKDDFDAQTYIQYYMQGGRHENQDNYPHVSVVDPRTGEQVKVWSGDPFPSATDFHAQLVEFLDRYSLDSKAKNPVAKTNPRKAVKDIDSMTEEEMLQMAMQKSLDAANGGSTSGANVSDPDELTASVPDLGQSDKGKEPAADAAMAEPSPSSIFASIASDKAHTEPANGPTTTRIQFRHPGGRVIRRFTAAEAVQRIYEWLKSEPLEGKAGIEFELKVMPEGRDLIGDLGKSIEEAGLKNGTVMIEFIE